MAWFTTTEIHARYAPDYRGAALRTIDDFFRELSPLLARRCWDSSWRISRHQMNCVPIACPSLGAFAPKVICPFGHIGDTSFRAHR
jgi:hypothetical protein